MSTAAYQTSSWRSLSCKGGITGHVAAEISHNCSCSNQSLQPGALRETGSNLGLPYYNTLQTKPVATWVAQSFLQSVWEHLRMGGGGDNWEQERRWPSQGNLPAAAESEPSELGQEMPCPNLQSELLGPWRGWVILQAVQSLPCAATKPNQLFCTVHPYSFSFLQCASVHQLLHHRKRSKPVKWDRISVSKILLQTLWELLSL